MTWTWTAQEIRRTMEKGGVLGKVAALYVAAGYNVVLDYETPAGKLGFLAKRGKETLAVDVYCNIKQVNEENMRKLIEKAKQVNGKPILVVYGPIRIPMSLYDLARRLGVKLKRVKPYSKIKPH